MRSPSGISRSRSTTASSSARRANSVLGEHPTIAAASATLTPSRTTATIAGQYTDLATLAVTAHHLSTHDVAITF